MSDEGSSQKVLRGVGGDCVGSGCDDGVVRM